MSNKNFSCITNEDGTKIIDICEGVQCLDESTLGSFADPLGEVVQINVPSTLECVSPLFWGRLDHVKRFKVHPMNKHFVDVDGCLFSADMREFVAFPPGKMVATYEIPSTVQVIAPRAFCLAGFLESIKVGAGVRKIGLDAFGFAWRLERIYIANSVTEIEDFFGLCGDLDCYISSRIGRMVGGVKGSAIEQWCLDNVVDFCVVHDDQVEDFLSSSAWNSTRPELSDEEYLAHWIKGTKNTDF